MGNSATDKDTITPISRMYILRSSAEQRNRLQMDFTLTRLSSTTNNSPEINSIITKTTQRAEYPATGAHGNHSLKRAPSSGQPQPEKLQWNHTIRLRDNWFHSSISPYINFKRCERPIKRKCINISHQFDTNTRNVRAKITCPTIALHAIRTHVMRSANGRGIHSTSVPIFIAFLL